MIIDCRSTEFLENPFRARVFLDGKEIRQVFYVDTEAGLLKTYDVIGDDGEPKGAWLLTPELAARGRREGWDMPIDGIVSKTIHGKVELLDIAPWNLCS